MLQQIAPWISTTRLRSVAEAYRAEGRPVIRIDLRKIANTKVEVWRHAPRFNGRAWPRISSFDMGSRSHSPTAYPAECNPVGAPGPPWVGLMSPLLTQNPGDKTNE